jgi:hypothetical protein
MKFHAETKKLSRRIALRRAGFAPPIIRCRCAKLVMRAAPARRRWLRAIEAFGAILQSDCDGCDVFET